MSESLAESFEKRLDRIEEKLGLNKPDPVFFVETHGVRIAFYRPDPKDAAQWRQAEMSEIFDKDACPLYAVAEEIKD